MNSPSEEGTLRKACPMMVRTNLESLDRNLEGICCRRSD